MTKKATRSRLSHPTFVRITMSFLALILWLPILFYQHRQAEKQLSVQLQQSTRALTHQFDLALSEQQTTPAKQSLEQLAMDFREQDYRAALYTAQGNVLVSSFQGNAPTPKSLPQTQSAWSGLHDGRLSYVKPLRGGAFVFATQSRADYLALLRGMAPVMVLSILLTGYIAGFTVRRMERRSHREVYNIVDDLDDRLKEKMTPSLLTPARSGAANELRNRINQLIRLLGTARDEQAQLTSRLEAVEAEQLRRIEEATQVRESAEQRLFKSERQYTQLVETSNGLIWAVDRKGNWSFLNKNATQLIYGQTPDNLIGTPFFTCSTAESLDRDEDMIKALLAGRSFFTYETVHKRADGSEVHLTYNAVPLFDEKRHIIGATGTATDVTARSQAEDRADELKGRLVRAERMESLGLLAGGVAHDLNNILGPVVGYPDLILEEIPPESAAVADLMEIKRSAKRASAVIQDLLTLSRRGGYQTLPVYMHDVVDDYLESATFKDLGMRFPDIQLERFFTENRKPLDGSIPHLNQVIMNLITNAYEAIETAGQVEVRIDNEFVQNEQAGYETIDPGHYVVLRVKDSGPGIPMDVLQKIFEPFFSSKKMGRSGTGLGLAVVYGVVKDLHGYLDVKTEPGQGTEFALFFPLTTEEPEVTPEEFRDFSGTETILVIDDVPEQRLLAKRLLGSVGYTVLTAEHGRAGVEMVKRSGRAIDMVIIDMVMEEGFDGLDTYLGIRQQFPQMPCIIVSGFSENDRVKDALRHGVHQYLKKPYTLDTIAAVIRDILDAQPETPPPATRKSMGAFAPPPVPPPQLSPTDTWSVPLHEAEAPTPYQTAPTHHATPVAIDESDQTQPIFLPDFDEEPEPEPLVTSELDDDFERTQAIALPDFDAPASPALPSYRRDDDDDSETTQPIILPDDF